MRRNTFGMAWSMVLVLPIIVSPCAWGAPREKLAEKTVPRIDARLYSQPNRYGQPISIAGRGLELKVLRYSTSRAWAFVETPSKRRGWIPVRSTTLGLRYSAGSLAAQNSARSFGSSSDGAMQVRRTPASANSSLSRKPASDLDDLGYDGSAFEGEAQDLVEAASAPPSLDTATVVDDVMRDDQSGSSVESSSTADGSSSNNVDVSALESPGEEVPQPQDSANDPAFDDSTQQNETVDTDALSQELGAIDGFSNSSRGQPAQRDERKPLRGVKIQKSDRTVTAKSQTPFEVNIGIEYANQLTVGQANGFGLGLGGSMALNDKFRLGLGLYWDRFSEVAQNAEEKVTRKAGVFRVGPFATFQQGVFGVDAMVGWTQTSTTMAVTNLQGAPITSEFNKTFSEGAIGMRLTPHFDFSLDGAMAVRAHLSYGIDFYPANGVDASVPQTLAVGVAFVLGF